MSAIRSVRKSTPGNARVVLASLITDPVVAAAIRPDEVRFSAEEYRDIAKLATDYFAKHGEPPKSAMTILLAELAEARGEAAENVLRTAEDIADRTDGFTVPESDNSRFVIELSQDVFGMVRVDELYDALGVAKQTRQFKIARDAIAAFVPPRVAADSFISPLTDLDQMRTAFAVNTEPDLIELPGDMGRFLEGALRRDSFVAVTAPEKTGKSYFMLNLAVHALRQRRRVVFGAAPRSVRAVPSTLWALRLWPRLRSWPLRHVRPPVAACAGALAHAVLVGRPRMRTRRTLRSRPHPLAAPRT